MIDPDTGQRILKLSSRTVDLAAQRIDVALMLDELDDCGRVTRTLFDYSLRYLFRGELEQLLLRTGYEIESVYGSCDLDEYSGDSEKLIAVARRPEQ
jgi:hypothetical protein